MSYRSRGRTRRSRRSGVTGFLENLIDDTKDFLDDTLDRDDDDDDYRGNDALRSDLNRLTQQVARLAAAQESTVAKPGLNGSVRADLDSLTQLVSRLAAAQEMHSLVPADGVRSDA